MLFFINFSNAILDAQPSSTILIKGDCCSSLLNFLKNDCDSIKLLNGPTAGVPPTLVSPTSFEGATLRTLTKNRNQITHGGKTMYSLEISGPIMPNCVQSLCYLVSSCVNSWTLSSTTSEGTGPFNQQPPKSDKENNAVSAFAKASLKDCGLPSDMIKRMCSINTNSKEILQEIKCNKEKFNYS